MFAYATCRHSCLKLWWMISYVGLSVFSFFANLPDVCPGPADWICTWTESKISEAFLTFALWRTNCGKPGQQWIHVLLRWNVMRDFTMQFKSEWVMNLFINLHQFSNILIYNTVYLCRLSIFFCHFLVLPAVWTLGGDLVCRSSGLRTRQKLSNCGVESVKQQERYN